MSGRCHTIEAGGFAGGQGRLRDLNLPFNLFAQAAGLKVLDGPQTPSVPINRLADREAHLGGATSRYVGSISRGLYRRFALVDRPGQPGRIIELLQRRWSLRLTLPIMLPESTIATADLPRMPARSRGHGEFAGAARRIRGPASRIAARYIDERYYREALVALRLASANAQSGSGVRRSRNEFFQSRSGYFCGDSGHGEPMLMVTGLGIDHTYYGLTAPILVEDFEVFTVDPRGSDSPIRRRPIASNRGRPILQMSSKTWGVGRACRRFFVGCGMAMVLAEGRPDLVCSLVLVGGFSGLIVLRR